MRDLQSWWQLTTIQIGGAVCLPVIMIGQTLGQNYGFLSAMIAIVIGNAILFGLAALTVKMTCANRKATIPNAEEYFGSQGIKFFAFAMIMSLTCWFGIQLNMMSLGVLELLSINQNKETWLLGLNVSLGLLMTVCILYGIRGIGVLANLALPCFILTLGYGVWTVEPITPSATPMSFGGISLVIALAIACVVDLPTYYRFARTYNDAKSSIIVKFLLVIPLLELCGVYMSSGVAEGNIMEVLKRENSVIWNIWVALFLILAGWTTNNLNLYSSAICLQSIFKNFSEKKSTLLIGIAGTILSCFDLLKHFELTLDIVGIFIAAMGSVVLARYAFRGYFEWMELEDYYLRNLVAWSVGIAMGFLSLMGFTFTSIAMIDSVIGGFLGVILTINYKELYEKA